MATTLGQLNPLRYRGYVYDQETGFYYLQSRYYNPEMGRFINADALVTTGQGFVGNNMFAYCGNNPVNMEDYSGDIPRRNTVGVVHIIIHANYGTYGWAQYYNAKGIIATAGKAYLGSKGYSLARAMFNHGMWGLGRSAPSSINKLIISRLKKSSIMKNEILKIIKKAKGDVIIDGGTVEFKNSGKVNTDLYYSLQHAKFTIIGRKSGGVWNLTISVSDRYDFDNIRSFSELSFGNAANDLGWIMQRTGMMVPYRFSVTYKMVY